MNVGWTIVVDPGHGGSDPGTTAGGLVEKTMNLATALAFKAKMEATYGDVEVILTRTSDVDMSLAARPAVAYNMNRENVIFVSFHHNSASASARGFEAYVYGAKSWVMSTGAYAPQTFAIVKKMEPALKSMCASLSLPYNGVKDGDFQVIRDARNHDTYAVLFESFYATNDAHAAIAKRGDFVDTLVNGYVDAFGQALGLVKKAPASPFHDVPANAWYLDDLRFLHDAGIVNGDSNGNFRPNDSLTRAEAAHLLRLVIRYITGK
jgi:N-acetylmuramoyl-L-alanine amidase